MRHPQEVKDFALELFDLGNSVCEVVRRTRVPLSTVSRWRVAEFGPTFPGLQGRAWQIAFAEMGRAAMREKRNGVKAS